MNEICFSYANPHEETFSLILDYIGHQNTCALRLVCKQWQALIDSHYAKNVNPSSILISSGCPRVFKKWYKNSSLQALFQGASRESFLCLSILINREDAVNHTDEEGNSLLHLAAKSGHVVMVEKLVERNANMRAVNAKGENPFLVAKLNGHDEVVKFLAGDLAIIKKDSSQNIFYRRAVPIILNK